MRFERKYILDNEKKELFKSFLLAYNFEYHFKERLVSSIYYDSVDFYLLKLSLDGISNRNKFRLRFYDNDITKIIIENKLKNAETNIKENKIFNNIKNPLLIDYPVEVFSDLNEIKALRIPRFLNFSYKPVVYIEYLRSYFVSTDKKLRITLDSFLSFARISSLPKSFKISNKYSYPNLIVEFKNEYKDQDNSNLIEPIVNKFSLQQSKFSKYCAAIETLY